MNTSTSFTFADHLEQRKTLLETTEVMEMLQSSRKTITRWAKDAKIPAHRINGKYMFDPMQLAAWLRARQMS